MTTRDRLTVAAAVAVALAAAALLPVFEGLGWVLRVVGVVAAVAGCAALGRRAGLPRALQPLAGLLGLVAYTCLVFARPTLRYGVVPGGDTVRRLRELFDGGMLDVAELAPPVPSRPGLVLLAVLGVGAIAVVVDLLAVTLRSAAVAGLPLLLLFAVPAAVLPDGLGWWPFALGAAGWLGLLLADGSDTVSRWGTPLRSGGRATSAPDPALGRVGRRIGAAALGIAVVVPALLPSLETRLLGGGSGDGLGGARSTTTYNPILELGGQLRLPEPGRLLMRYTTDDPTPDYLRLTTLDRFDEANGWSSSELSADLQDDAVQDGIPVPLDSSQVDLVPVTTSIDVGRLQGPWLPTPFPPSGIDIEGPWLWDEESQTVFSTRTSLDDIDGAYTVSASRAAPTPQLLRGASGLPTEIAETYAVAPVVSPYVADLLDRTVGDAQTDYDKVAAVQALFRDASNGFQYSEDASVPGFDGPDALENFLRGKRGFCEQYASAMGALVRALGIPARVAVGFTPGSQRRDGTYEVTTSDAHAWPEVWFSGAGWVRFEPTPRSSQVTTPDYTVPPADAPAAETAPSAAPAPGTVPSTGPAPGAVDRGDDIAAGAGTDADAGLSRRETVLLTVLGVALVLAVLPALLAAVRRRRRVRAPGALAAWAQVQDDAVDVGHRWRPADSPRTAARHLAAARSLPGPAREALDRLALGAELARYARPGSTHPELRVAAVRQGDPGGVVHGDALTVGSADADEAAAHVLDARLVRSALLAGTSRSRRWQARLAPASTLQWAATGLGGAMADLLDRFDTAVSAVGDRVRHPGVRLRRRPAG